MHFHKKMQEEIYFCGVENALLQNKWQVQVIADAVYVLDEMSRHVWCLSDEAIKNPKLQMKWQKN